MTTTADGTRPPPPFTLPGVEAQVHAVVAPLAASYCGSPLPVIRTALSRAWRQAFGGPLGEPALSWCAVAIHDRSDWHEGLCGTDRHSRP